MTYSYTQISRYLSCPRRYRHQYLDGWQEKDGRASMLFGRAFEKALAAYFLREDCTAVLFREWSLYRAQGLQFSSGQTWDRMLEQGVQLLGRFAQDDRVRVLRPRRNLQIKFTRPLANGNDFCRVRLCHRPAGWNQVLAGMENDLQPLSRRARWTAAARSSACLLFLGYWHL